MKVRMLTSSPDRPEQQFLTTFLVDGRLAIDAGCLGLNGTVKEQAGVGHVFITHSHADHVCSLPMFLTNVLDERRRPVMVYGHPHTLASLESDLFNDRCWPSLSKLSRNGTPAACLTPLTAGAPVAAGRLRVTPVPVNHTVPTFGYIVDDGRVAVVFSSDSGPTDEIWRRAASISHLRAVFMGAAFPDECLRLAKISGHLTPRLFRVEASKLPDTARILAIHLKAGRQADVITQLKALDLPNVSVAAPGAEYAF